MAGEDWKEFECSSGVTVLYGPFPHGMYHDIMDRALQNHADPDVPTRTIEVLLGTEEIDDPEDPDYLKALAEVQHARYKIVADAAVDFCMEVKGGLGPWEDVMELLASKYASPADPVPESGRLRQSWFLKRYALRTKKDWTIIGKIQSYSQIDEEEIRRKVDQFPGDVEGPEGDGDAASGPVAEQRVEVHDEGAGPDGGEVGGDA